MILNEQKLKTLLQQPLQHSVFYYFSVEEYLVRSYAEKTLSLLCRQESVDVTRIEGPAPRVEEIIAAAGTISLFGTKRIVALPLVEPSAWNDTDLKALCDVLASMENAVVVLTTVFKDEKAKSGKKAKQLIAAAEKNGIVAELIKPQQQDAKRFVIEKAQQLGAQLSPLAASALLERCGADFFLLENEVAKLAAAAQYREISPSLIADMGTKNIEADVFEMVRFVTAKNQIKALAKLSQLLELQNEPVAIVAALSGSFVDMYRVKCGQAAKQNYTAVHQAFGYRGNDYRLKKSGETAARYTREQLARILQILLQLDAQLKSSAMDKVVLLQTALCEIAAIGARV